MHHFILPLYIYVFVPTTPNNYIYNTIHILYDTPYLPTNP